MVTVWEIRMAEVNIVHNATNAQRKIKLLKKKIKKNHHKLYLWSRTESMNLEITVKIS